MHKSVVVLVLLVASISLAQTPRTRIVFPKKENTPRLWTRYNPDNLSPDTEFGFNGRIAPFPLRSFIKRRKSFTYLVDSLLPGSYDVKFGFFDRFICTENKRIFRMEANGLTTPPLDLVKEIGGCAMPLYVTIKGVPVSADGILNVTAVRVRGAKPLLNNLEIFGVSPPGPASTSASPTASSSSTPQAAQSASASPSPLASTEASPTPSASQSAVASASGSASASATPSGSVSAAASPSASQAMVASPSPSASGSPTVPEVVYPGSAKVAFHKFSKPSGWETYNVDGLDVGVEFASGGSSAGPDPAYVSHMKKRADFSYVHMLAAGEYDVRLGFLEYGGGCSQGKRVFKVRVNGRETNILDVFGAVGCNTPYDVTLRKVTVGADGVLLFEFTNVDGYAPYLANFEASAHDPNESPHPEEDDVDIFINAGSKSDVQQVANSDTAFYSGTVTNSAGEAPNFYYKSSRYGMDFTYSFDLAPGTYDVTLGFAENYAPVHCSETGKRVFHVYINGLVQLEGFDIFARVGCHVAEEMTFYGQSVGSVDTKPLAIRFVAIANNAVVNYIRIKTAADRCIPASSSGGLQNGEDHAAHAVPGSYPPQLGPNSPTSYVDSDGDGFVWVDINGDGSHTHFFDSALNIIGRITEFKWTLVETGEVISTEEKFRYKFPLGTTRLKLAVLDNSCTRDEAETTVTVTGRVQPGQYCYYYQGLSEAPVGGALLTEAIPPSFAHISSSVNLGFPSFAFDQSMFAVRCHFFLQVDTESAMKELSVDVGDTGTARLYKGVDLVLDTSSSPTVSTALPTGLTAFELVYLRQSDSGTVPVLKLLVDGVVPPNSHISHDRTTVLPILSATEPNEGLMAGGTRVKVKGYGLFQPLSVTFGTKTVNVIAGGQSKTQFFVDSPQADTPEAVAIRVTTPAGATSNAVYFSYGGTCDSVKFTETSMLTAMDQDVDNLELPTCVVLGHDGRMYMGTLGGTVQVLSYHHKDLRVSGQCYSKPIVDPKYVKNGKPATRDILGIAIDPRDIEIRPLVSTSTLYWLDKGRLDNPTSEAWRNGAVDRLKPGSDAEDVGVCLVYDKRVISNLPVSNHDHGVNALLFTQQGDLLVSIGGFTNMGLPGWKLGGFWETDLSAAVIKAELSNPAFDGELQYENEGTPRLARVVSDYVSVYVSGIRNGFGMAMTRQGEVYLVDQGPNCSFGDTATSCSDYDESVAASWDPEAQVDWQGKVKHGWTNCPYGIGRGDKVVHVTEGSYYGHPNLQRGGDECIWVDPKDQLTADDKEAPASYKGQMALLKSPVTGIAEYGGNDFCGRMRGELVMSTYKSGDTYRMGVDGDVVKSGPDVLAGDGGLSFVENAHGDLIFPQLNEKKVMVLDRKSVV